MLATRPASAAISGWRMTPNSTTCAGAIRSACSITSGTPAVSATSVSQTTSARRFCAAITAAAAAAWSASAPSDLHERQRVDQRRADARRRAPARRAAAAGGRTRAARRGRPDASATCASVSAAVTVWSSIVCAADARAQQPAGVDEQPHGLAALGLVDLGDELAAPRRRAPAHVAPLVARPIVAQAVELAPGPGAFRAPLLDRDLTAANQIQRLLPAFVKIRIDPDGLLERRETPSLDETPRAAPLQDDAAHQGVAALARSHLVFDAAVAARRNGERQLGQCPAEARR